MFKINLVPEVQEKKQQVSKLNYITTVSSLSVLGVIVVVLVIIGGLILTNKGMASGVEKNISSVNTELESYSDLEKTVLSLESGLAGAKKILDNGTPWTKLLPQIEKATPTDIKFTKILLDNGKISASLEGKDINSLARFVESFKKYKIFSMYGSGTASEKLQFYVDKTDPIEIVVKSSGQWVYPISFDAATDHLIEIRNSDGEEIDLITYTAADKKIKSENGGIKIEDKNLFSAVEVSQYRKDGTSVTFEATMLFDGALIW